MKPSHRAPGHPSLCVAATERLGLSAVRALKKHHGVFSKADLEVF